MKQEIKFRALTIDKSGHGKWVCGHYTEGQNNFHYITNNDGSCWQIDPKTIGQFTGLIYNKIDDGFNPNGDYKTKIEIYRHDILEYTQSCTLNIGASYYAEIPPQKGERFIVIQTNAGFMLENLSRTNIKTIEDLLQRENGPENQYYRIDNYSFWNGMPSLKLIGNIHENPELIK